MLHYGLGILSLQCFMYGFIMNPGPYLIENGCLGSFEMFALTVKMYLEAFDLVKHSRAAIRWTF